MRLLTRMRHEEDKDFGVNNQGINKPLKVVQRPPYAGLRYTEVEFSKVSYASETPLKLLRKENDWNTHSSSDVSAHGREWVEAISHCHTYTRDSKERYNHSWHSSVHFNYNHVVKDERKSWNQKTSTFFGLDNHTFSMRWKIIATHKRMRCERPSQQ